MARPRTTSKKNARKKASAKGSWLQKNIREISKLDRYVRPEKIRNAFKLDSNENFALDREFISRASVSTATSLDLREYPLDEFGDIYKQLASYTGVDERCIAVGSGSDQIIELILSTIGKGKCATVFTPTFSYFLNRCQLHGIKVDQIPLKADFALDKAAFAKSAKKSQILYVCSPNNPTGNQIDKSTIIEIIESLSDKLILVDEAYADFADYSLADYASKYRGSNVIVVLRTLSKAFGLAGARVGYMVSEEDFAETFRAVIQSPYPVSSISLAIATNVLSRSDYVKKVIEVVKEERSRVFDSLTGIKSIKVYRSDANFLLVETGTKYHQIVQALNGENIVVKSLGNIKSHKGCIRVTIGPKSVNDKLIECVKRAVA